VRRGAIITLIAVAELGCAGLVIDVAASAGPGMASTVTVSVDGAIGTWAPAPTQSSAAAPATTGTAGQAPAASLDPPSGQPIAPSTPSTLETTPAPTAVAPVGTPSSSGEPDPTTP
jgi:hypothetical protein